MGGTLTLTSTPGTGSHAVVCCPLVRSGASEPVPASAPGVSSHADLAGVRVLVVDDLEPSRELLEAMFRTFAAIGQG